jgi:SAM-dependent methyltransferase
MNTGSWEEFYRDGARSFTYPSELVVAFFRGRYFIDEPVAGKKILEVGFGSGNNLTFLHSLGLNISGCEIDQSICVKVKSQMVEKGIEADLRVGMNSSLPFPDQSFDFLLSWNCLHYESDEQSFRNAIFEYSRVLKSTGRCFVSTTAPDSPLMIRAVLIGDGLYKIGVPGDFRVGQVHRCLQDEAEAKLHFGRFFERVEVGRSKASLGSYGQDSWLITAVKP